MSVWWGLLFSFTGRPTAYLMAFGSATCGNTLHANGPLCEASVTLQLTRIAIARAFLLLVCVCVCVGCAERVEVWLWCAGEKGVVVIVRAHMWSKITKPIIYIYWIVIELAGVGRSLMVQMKRPPLFGRAATKPPKCVYLQNISKYLEFVCCSSTTFHK